jgi:tubulin-folding cofactor B
MAEVRLDLSMTVFQVKLQVEKRYGSDANFVSLTLKDKSGNVVHRMNNDGAIFGTYQPRDGYIIHVTDSNPNSVLKGITQPPFLGLEDVNSV